jgi:hypothetical protein
MSLEYQVPRVVGMELKLEHPGFWRGALTQGVYLGNYLRDSGSDMFLGDFWFKYATIF